MMTLSRSNMDSLLFKHGSAWIRADFHLHTKADTEFDFKDPENKRSFKKEYVAQLEQQGIRLGVITNHNKFDLAEYKSLRECARKSDIYLMPGVELSVNDGRTGLHCLIVFDYENWIKSDENYIEEHFLKAAFEGIGNRYHENTPCKYNLEQTLEKLHEHQRQGRDTFVIMAHVEDDKGFLKEMGGGRIKPLTRNDLFRRFVLGFQKFRTNDNIQSLQQWFGDEIPAFLEGSDCKRIEAVGRAQQQNGDDKNCYLKLGAYNFEAVKYALLHHQERVSTVLPPPMALALREVRIMRGSDSVSVPLNAGLNTIIGVRGGGKSSLLETIRFGFGLRATQEDQQYKDEVVIRLLGHGGQVDLVFFDECQREQYIVRRVYGHDAQVFDSHGKLKIDLPAESLMKIAYFGQKDLAVLGKGFNEKVFEETLLLEEIKPYKKAIENAESKVRETIRQWERVQKETAREQTVKSEIARLEQFIRTFEEKGLEGVLRREHNYQQDATQLEIIAERIDEFATNLSDYLEGFDADDLLRYSSEEADNQDFFIKNIFPHIHQYLTVLAQAKQQLTVEWPAAFAVIRTDFEARLTALRHEFAKAKQGIDPSIRVEQYSEAKRSLQVEREKLGVIKKEKEKLNRYQNQLDNGLNALKQAWKAEFEFLKTEIAKLNDVNTTVHIDIVFQGDKKRWTKHLKDYAGGARLHDAHYDKIAEHYDNNIAIYQDMYRDDSELSRILSGGGLLSRFQDKITEKLDEFLICRTPDHYIFHYNGKDLSHYSIGQKATALIAFILSNHHKNLFLIDQPEDDLDNHTVAKEIIDRIKNQKREAQFVFVTHNPNILVLGDSEQVIVCEHDSEQQKVNFNPIGSIDQPAIQQTAVNIMEGGKEAFERRKNIYQIWKH